MKLIIISILLINCKLVIGQIPVFTPPQPATMNINGFQQNSGVQYFNPMQQEQLRIQQQNQQIMQEVEQYERLRERQNELNNEAYNDIKSIKSNSFSFPSNESKEGTIAFKQAFVEFQKMLNGQKPLSIKRAVFLSENAFYDNTLSSENFTKTIDNIAYICKLEMLQNKMPNSELAKNMTIFKFMSDTISVKLPNQDKRITHYPMTYDFKDCWADSTAENIFVTKLLRTQTGQCHSMPLLYLIIAEKLGSKAYLSYSPNHCYIKIPLEKGKFQNVELTSGILTSDAHVMLSGFVKSAAIENKIYMDTLGKKEVVASCLMDLANVYYRKFGYDNFFKQCFETVLKYHPNNIQGLIGRSNYYNGLMEYIVKKNPGLNRINIKQIPLAYNAYLKADESWYYLQEISVEKMPRDKYQLWRQSGSKDESKKSYQQIQKSLLNIK
jgi:tRNA(Ser,Leu) C12 N-acetylase TAN1